MMSVNALSFENDVRASAPTAFNAPRLLVHASRTSLCIFSKYKDCLPTPFALGTSPHITSLTDTEVSLNDADPAFFALRDPSSADSFPTSLASDFSSAEHIGELAPKALEAAHRRSRRISEVLDAKEGGDLE